MGSELRRFLREDRARWSLQGVENIEKQVQFNEAFTRHLNSIGIRTVNLTEPFIESARIENARLYYWFDVHWTKLGNTVSAQVVSQYLMETLNRTTVKASFIPSSSGKQERSQATPLGMR
jgi:SGNH hydrolase-like domain, acetyltransferase AlgX